MLRPTLRATRLATLQSSSKRSASALSNATVSNLQNRWEGLPEVDQKDIISQLSERQKNPWSELTVAEKKAAWYISFGEWGPRRPIHTKEDKLYIFWGVTIGLGLSAALFGAFRYFGNKPKSMNRQWQEKTDEYLKSKNAEPFTGYSQIQSK